MLKKIILHIPHSSVNIAISDGYVDDANRINNELIKLTDWYTDEMFYSENDNKITALNVEH
jgi:N-formylglutamate deformylase